MVSHSEIITAADAKSRGLKWYFTGVSCRNGHMAKRSLSNRECRRCVDERDGRKRAMNLEEWRSADRELYHRNVEKKRAQSRASRARNIKKRRAYDRERYRTNPARREYQINQSKMWWKLNSVNRGKAAAQAAMRRASVRRATPPWLTKEHRKQIRAFYIEAAARDGEWHVDHIHPIRGKLVCGLHVPWNLQILSGSENMRKQNVFTPT
jgi:hypothetical protein